MRGGKNPVGEEWVEFAHETNLGAVRAAEGSGKERHQQKMSSLSRLGAALRPAVWPELWRLTVYAKHFLLLRSSHRRLTRSHFQLCNHICILNYYIRKDQWKVSQLCSDWLEEFLEWKVNRQEKTKLMNLKWLQLRFVMYVQVIKTGMF